MRDTRLVRLDGGLAVELRTEPGLRYLDVRSLLDPEQSFLLPLPSPPAIEGLALTTRLSRVHGLPWALAWGKGTPPEGCAVVFSSDSLRFRRSARVVPQLLGDEGWVAAVEGVFSSATTVVAGVETAHVLLANRY